MSTEGVVLAIVFTLVVAAIVGLPLLRGSRVRPGEALMHQKQRERLLLYYERVITNIRDLDEDLSTGKISAEQHAAEREEWLQRGIQVLRTLDAFESSHEPPMEASDEAEIDEAIDHAIEAAVAAARQR